MHEESPDYDASKLERIQKCPLIIAVAGHANHGKTSTVRTLCRLPEWGDVADLAGTTKKAKGVKFKIAGKTFMIIFDTPGFQNSSRAIEECRDPFTIEDIRRFFQGRQDFSDDSKALEQVLGSQIVLYVIDGTCAPTENLQNDFRILARSGIPVIPLFNFTKDGNSDEHKAWIAFLHHHNYHLEVTYDAHFYRPEYERDLYKKILILLKDPLHREFFNWYVAKRESDEHNMAQKAVAAMAEMLLDCAAYRHEVAAVEPKNKDEVQLKAIDRFQKAIADHECLAFQDMVTAYNFKPELLESKTGSEGCETLWKQDLFGKEIQRHLGIGVPGGAAAGLAIGGAADLLVSGASFFAFAASGAVVGAIAGALGAGLYNNNFDRSSHTITIQCTAKTCHVLIERALLLLMSLQQRGMADQGDFVVSDKAFRSGKTDFKKLLSELTDLANKPSFSLIGVDSADVGKQVITERKSRLAKIEGLIELLANKAEDAVW